jgi:hypothetical protein
VPLRPIALLGLSAAAGKGNDTLLVLGLGGMSGLSRFCVLPIGVAVDLSKLSNVGAGLTAELGAMSPGPAVNDPLGVPGRESGGLLGAFGCSEGAGVPGVFGVASRMNGGRIEEAE